MEKISNLSLKSTKHVDLGKISQLMTTNTDEMVRATVFNFAFFVNPPSPL
jgi:hypothetical protein